MPAVYVDKLSLLEKIRFEALNKLERQVSTLTTAPSGFEGEGFPVKRAFYGVPISKLDPFVHMDQMGQVNYRPGEPKGTPWHPHRGFETVTYIMDGTFVHQDSNGGGGRITNGDTQWMTAGSGILHIETPPEELVVSGGLFHGIQLWVNLPKSKKFAPPRYQDIRAEKVSLFSTDREDSLMRVIAGEIDGHGGPGLTHTPIVLAHGTLFEDSMVEIPTNSTYNALIYVLSGSGFASTKRVAVKSGQLVTFSGGDYVTLFGSKGENLEFLLLSGEPINEPVVQYGPFVMNTRDEIKQAFEDYESGKLGTVPAKEVDV